MPISLLERLKITDMQDYYFHPNNSSREYQEMDEWQAFLDTLGYRYWDENNNPAYHLFLGAQRTI